jgi:hypothetical protein
MGVPNALQERGDRLFEHRMAEVRRQFGEGSQDKPAKVQTRMRNRHLLVARLVDDLIPIE